MPRKQRVPAVPSARAAEQRDALPPGRTNTAWSLRRLAPFLLLLTIAVVHSVSYMNIGVDTWVSLAGGRHILAHGVTLADPFSYNSRPPGSPPPGSGSLTALAAWLHPTGWINQNWLTHVFLAWLESTFGLNALAVWKLLNYLLVAAVLLANARLRRAQPVLAVLVIAASLLVSRWFFEVRAQDVTNLLAAVLMLLLTLAVLRTPRAVWLVVPLFALWANVHGGFVWGLMALVVFLAASVAAPRLPGRLLIVSPATVRAGAIAAVGALAAVVVASPYRLANLTHPLVISASADSRVWQKIFEWTPLARGTVGERTAFVIFAALAVVAAALTGIRMSSVRAQRPSGRADEVVDPTSALDLGSASVVLLTGVMAVTSRRFVPMAYLVGAPLLAQWITCAGERFLRRRAATGARKEIEPVRLTRRLARPALWLLAVAVAIAYAIPFSKSYLAPWPFDGRRGSLADRVLLTSGEPWGACQFVTLNHLQGRMWNFWESGGFWARCQPPDPVSGRIPVQIAIDGRAQAAYDVGVFRWHNLLEEGGPTGLTLGSAGRQPSDDEQTAIRAWVAGSLAGADIRIAHIAQRNLDAPLAFALLTMPDWQVVYVDANHFLLVDSATPQGRDLAARIDSGAAAFPDQVSSLLTRAYRTLHAGAPDSPAKGLALARQAWAAQPTARAVALAALAGADPGCADQVRAFFQSVVDDQLMHAVEHAREPGYYERMVGAAFAARSLEQAAATRGDAAGRQRAAEQSAWLSQEADRISLVSDW